MKNKHNDEYYTKQITKHLLELRRDHGHHPSGAHLIMATEGSNLEFLTEKQIVDALEVYLAQLNLDIESQIINYNEDLMTDLDEEDIY